MLVNAKASAEVQRNGQKQSPANVMRIRSGDLIRVSGEGLRLQHHGAGAEFQLLKGSVIKIEAGGIKVVSGSAPKRLGDLPKQVATRSGGGAVMRGELGLTGSGTQIVERPRFRWVNPVAATRVEVLVHTLEAQPRQLFRYQLVTLGSEIELPTQGLPIETPLRVRVEAYDADEALIGSDQVEIQLLGKEALERIQASLKALDEEATLAPVERALVAAGILEAAGAWSAARETLATALKADPENLEIRAWIDELKSR